MPTPLKKIFGLKKGNKFWYAGVIMEFRFMGAHQTAHCLLNGKPVMIYAGAEVKLSI
jgi:hypothetical protein